jgi:hypothetical protein
LPHLAIFCPFALSHSSVTLQTITPPLPPVVPDLGPRADRCLIPGPAAHRHLDTALTAHHHRPLPQAVHVQLLVTVTTLPSTSTLPPSKGTTTIILDLTSLGARHCHPLPQALDTASGEGDTPPLPHYRCHLVRYLLPYVTVCANVNEI